MHRRRGNARQVLIISSPFYDAGGGRHRHGINSSMRDAGCV